MPKDSLPEQPKSTISPNEQMRKLHIELDGLVIKEIEKRKKYDKELAQIEERKREIFRELQRLNKGANK